MSLRVLVVDDDESICHLIHDALVRTGAHVEWRLQGEEAFELLRENDFDVVLTDINLGAMNGLELCKKVTENRPDIPVIVITGFGSMSSAVTAMRAGAYDFIPKPVDLVTLALCVERAARHRCLREQVRRLECQVAAAGGAMGGLIGESRSMHGVYDLIRRVGPTDTTVLLSGESGTGKELVARALHMASDRAQMPFVAVNCAAVPASLLESELFGHVRGAFTDAKEGRRGLFQQADGGTLLLDEIGEMPLDMQPKLLRVLQERQLRPVGGNTVVSVNVRIITATNLDLEGQVEERRFREDLFYRLNVVQLHVPPLRARGNDILLLAGHFVKKFAERAGRRLTGISPAAARKLLAYDWPGNVRQLENCIERAIALARTSEIALVDLPERIQSYEDSRLELGVLDSGYITLEELEERHVKNALIITKGNKTLAAKLLGVDRRTIYRMLNRYTHAERRAAVADLEGHHARCDTEAAAGSSGAFSAEPLNGRGPLLPTARRSRVNARGGVVEQLGVTNLATDDAAGSIQSP